MTTALDLARDRTGDELARFESLFEVHPGGEALGLVAGKDRVAVAVFNGLDGNRDEVARLDGDFTLVILELFDGHVGFALQTGVHDDEVVVDADDFSGDDFTLTHFLAGKALLKELSEGFGLVGFVGHCGMDKKHAQGRSCR